MSKPRKNEILTFEEGAQLLGAEKAAEIPDWPLDPITMRVIATQIGERLKSDGGRPTDPSWKISRKIPMKKETWRKLERLSQAAARENRRVATGQLAAVALEKGVEVLMRNGEEEEL